MRKRNSLLAMLLAMVLTLGLTGPERASGSGRMRPAVTYLTYPLQGGITVTDSQGVSPYSVCRTGGAGWHLLTSVLF